MQKKKSQRDVGKGGRDAGSGEEGRKKDTEVWEKSDKMETSWNCAESTLKIIVTLSHALETIKHHDFIYSSVCMCVWA